MVNLTDCLCHLGVLFPFRIIGDEDSYVLHDHFVWLTFESIYLESA